MKITGSSTKLSDYTGQASPTKEGVSLTQESQKSTCPLQIEQSPTPTNSSSMQKGSSGVATYSREDLDDLPRNYRQIFAGDLKAIYQLMQKVRKLTEETTSAREARNEWCARFNRERAKRREEVDALQQKLRRNNIALICYTATAGLFVVVAFYAGHYLGSM